MLHAVAIPAQGPGYWSFLMYVSPKQHPNITKENGITTTAKHSKIVSTISISAPLLLRIINIFRPYSHI